MTDTATTSTAITFAVVYMFTVNRVRMQFQLRFSVLLVWWLLFPSKASLAHGFSSLFFFLVVLVVSAVADTVTNCGHGHTGCAYLNVDGRRVRMQFH